MAEPLSVLASVAGVATAGVAISKMIYEIAHTVKHAPKEVSEMAGELSLLSSVLRYLRSALAECIDVCRPRLIKDIRGTVSKIHGLHKQIKELTKNSTSSFYRMGLLFKSPKTKNLLAQIEGFKNSVSVMLTTVQLAAAKKQLKISKELASKTDVGEIRQLLENLLFANQDSIDRIRRRQMFDLDPPPAPPQVRIYRDYGRRIHTPSPPPPPTPPYRGRRRPPSPTRTIFHADLEKSQKGPNTDKVVPRSGPVRRVSSPGQHDQTKRDPNREIGSRTPKGSHSEPHHPSFVDWDSDKEEEVEHDQHEDRTDKVVDNLTSTAIVLRKRDETEHSTPPGQMQSKHEVKGPKPETRFLLSSGRSKTDVEPISNQKIKTNENGKEIEDSDESEYSESEGGSDVSSNSLHVLGGRSDDETLDKSTFMVNGKRNEGRGRVDPTDYWSWDRQQHSGHTRHRTDLTHGSRGDSPDDAATWLYRLVFLDDHRQGRPFNRSYSTRAIQLPEDEVPRTADRLLLQWTNAEPTTDNIEDHTSDVEAVMADPDPSWSRQLRTRISRITADEKQYTYRNPRDIHVNVSDSDASSDNPYAYNRNKCRHGRIKRDCAICKDPEPWDRDETFGSRRPRGRGSSLPRHAGAGENIHPGAVPHYQPDVPYAHYERTEQERAYQTHRNETLTKDIERLETTFRRTEALHAKEIAHRERMEMQLEKQYESNLKSIQDQMGTMKQDNYSMDSVQKRQLEFQLNHEHETRVKSLREQYETEIKQSAEVQAKLESHLRETLESLEKMKKVEAQEKKAEEEEKMYRAKREAEAEMQKKENAKPTRTCLQVSTLADRDQSWTPRFPSLGLSFSRLDGAPTRTSIHGTLCFTKPFLPSLSELYQVLKTHEWRPLWMRGSSGGKTWFLGRTPILVDFFRREYMPQVGKQHDQTGAPVYLSDTEDEYAAVGMGLIERDAIDELDLPYKGRVDGQHRFSVHLTYEDVESLIATSLLMRERRHRKACLGNLDGNAVSSSRNISVSPTASTPTLDVPKPAGRSSEPQLSKSGDSDERSRRHRKKSNSSRRDL